MPEMATNAVTAAKEGMDTRKGSQIEPRGVGLSAG
jgi:hypothetical protein